jgi:hypothetical protein
MKNLREEIDDNGMRDIVFERLVIDDVCEGWFGLSFSLLTFDNVVLLLVDEDCSDILEYMKVVLELRRFERLWSRIVFLNFRKCFAVVVSL